MSILAVGRTAAGDAADAGRACGGARHFCRGRNGVRGDREVAAIDDGPTPGRRPDHADRRRLRAARRAGRPARPHRRAPPAGGGVEPGSRGRGAAGRRRLRAAAGAARERPVRRRRDQQTGAGAGRDRTHTLAPTTVSFVSPRVDDQTQSVLVKGQVKNPGGTLRAAQYVRARIVWKTDNVLVVPVTAVVRINGQFFAFVAEDAGGKLVAKQRAIKVGAIAGENYPVLDGIKAGERVVTSGAQKLMDGAPIQNQNQNQNPEPRTPNPEPSRDR